MAPTQASLAKHQQPVAGSGHRGETATDSAVRVVGFYERFMARYPGPAKLAQAPAAEVLAM